MPARKTITDRIATLDDDWASLDQGESSVRERHQGRENARASAVRAGGTTGILAAMDFSIQRVTEILFAHKRRFLELYEEIARLREEMQRSSGVYYVGTWDPQASYSRGAMTTSKGALWHCEADRTTDRPGTSSAWKLMHKNMSKGGR